MSDQKPDPTPPDKESVQTAETVTTRVGDVSETRPVWKPGNPTPNLNAALAAAQGKFPTPPKNKTATIPGKDGRTGYSFDYADLADVIAACREAMSEHDLSVVNQIQPGQSGGMVLTVTLRHASGEYISSALPLNGFNKPQELGSQLTFFRRYLLSGLIGVASETDDDANLATDNGGTTAPRSSAKKTTTAKNASSSNSKPVTPGNKTSSTPAKSETPSPAKPETPAGGISEAQIRRLFGIAKTAKWTEQNLIEVRDVVLTKSHWKDLDRKQYDWICNVVEKNSFDDFTELFNNGQLSAP